MLQWSRDQLNAESAVAYYDRDGQKIASMEPRSIERGKWCGPSRRGRRSTRFNGAAIN